MNAQSQNETTVEVERDAEPTTDLESPTPPIVAAKCLAQAWGPMAGTTQCAMYYPGRGPLEGGLYEIESGTALDTLTTPTGEWIFQYPGHEGKDPELPARLARARQKHQGIVPHSGDGAGGEEIAAAFDALHHAYKSAVAELDAEQLRLEQERAELLSAAESLKLLLPAKAREAERQADALLLAGKREEAEAEMAKQRQAEAAPAEMEMRRATIGNRISEISDEKRAIARGLFRDDFEGLRAPVIAMQTALLGALQQTWQEMNRFGAETGILEGTSPLPTDGWRRDLTLRDRGKERELFEALQKWFGGRQ